MIADRSIYIGRWRVDVSVRPTAAALPSGSSVTGLARTVARVLEAAGATPPGSLGLVFADDLELAELNERHLGESGPTDVLSFPLLPPNAYPVHEGVPEVPTIGHGAQPFALPPGRRRHLGDIVVSVERALSQAHEGRGGQTGDVAWSGGDELRLLVTHGTLHVCGWDHAAPLEEAAMRALERRLLSD